MNKKERSEHARKLSALGASKGGRARASVLTQDERRQIAKHAAEMRWKKAGKRKENPVDDSGNLNSDREDDQEQPGSENEGDLQPDEIEIPADDQPAPYAMYSGNLMIGNVTIPCHVLNDSRRVLHQRAMVKALGMQRGGSSRGGGDRLAYFVDQKRLKPYVSNTLLEVTKSPITFKTVQGPMAYGYEASVLAEICEAVLAAQQAGALQEQQEHIAERCLVLMRGFARVGIDALVDEATGFDKVKKKQAYQLKLQAFIAEDMQEWAVMFPEEFWWELARLEGIHYSPRSRPLRWGKYVMFFVYDAIDPDIGNWLRENNPDPHFKMNHHQWMKKYGRERVHDQITQVVTIMKLCRAMADFREKFAHVFRKSPLQLTFDDLGW